MYFDGVGLGLQPLGLCPVAGDIPCLYLPFCKMGGALSSCMGIITQYLQCLGPSDERCSSSRHLCMHGEAMCLSLKL